MSRTRPFIAGVVAGTALAAATAYAATLKSWTAGTLTAANEIVGDRSGLAPRT